jgi:heat shock protein HtpX
VVLILAPIVAKAMQATISRRRETLADVSACQLTRYPPGLISALEKLKADTTVTHSASTATAHLWIEQPMSGVGDDGKLGGIHRMFDTHPPLDERIALLREL